MKITTQDKLLFPEILAARKKDVHKRIVGSVLVVAGSRGMSGAAALSCEATMRAGAGVVLLAFPKSLHEVYQRLIPEVLTLPCNETEDETLDVSAFENIFEASKKYDVILIGPGLSQHEKTRHLVCKLYKYLKQEDKRVILDADGLNAFSGHTELLDNTGKNKTIFLPHPGEMARLCGIDVEEVQQNRVWLTNKKAKKWDGVVTLKGHQTVVSNGDKVIVNETGGPALAKAGTGDVLAGIVSAFWAGNLDKPFEAVADAVYLHGLAGDMAAKEMGERSVLASDVIMYLHKAILESKK